MIHGCCSHLQLCMTNSLMSGHLLEFHCLALEAGDSVRIPWMMVIPTSESQLLLAVVPQPWPLMDPYLHWGPPSGDTSRTC